MSIHFTEERQLISFDKSFSANIHISEPDKYKILEEISKRSEKIINVGSNLSYSPLGFSKDSLSVNLKKFNRILEFNEKSKEITIEAGITLIEFLNFSLKYNLWIPQLPGYPTITIGGAVAANSHGKSCAIHGTIRKSIKKILLFHKDHGWINLSEQENKELFDLTIGGLGLTGTIVTVTLKLTSLENSEFVTRKKIVKSIEESKRTILEDNKKNSFIYTWNRADSLKNFGEGIVFQNEVKSNSNIFKEFKESKNHFYPSFIPLWNKYSIKLVNSIFLAINKFSTNEKKEDFLSVIFPFYGKERYFNFFGKRGFIESQLLIHESKLDMFIDEFKRLFKNYEPTITLFSLKNMSGEQKYLRFEDNKICITFDYVYNKKNLNFMSMVDKLYEKYNILPSIIKDSRISKEVFKSSYNVELLRFIEEIYKFDKKRIYQSETSSRLEI